MARNPDKIRCAVPGCRNWAMRSLEGDERCRRCRIHRDVDLSRRGIGTKRRSRRQRGVGAPPGNLNELRHGAHAHLLPAPDFERLVATAIEQPADFPLQIGLAARSIQAPKPTRAMASRMSTSRSAVGIWISMSCCSLTPAPIRD